MTTELSTESPFHVLRIPPLEHGRLEVLLCFVGALDEATVTRWANYIELTFLELCFLGGLGGDRHAPTASDVGEWECRVAADKHGSSLVWLIDKPRIDPGALRVLVNLIEHGLYVFETPIVEVVIGFGAISEAKPFGRPDFPLVWPDLPFEVEEYPIESGDLIQVEIVFDRKYPDRDLDTLINAMQRWMVVLVNGGFGGHPFAQWTNGVVANDPPYVEVGSSLILKLEDFRAHVDAFSSLLNVLAAVVHRGGPRIEAVIINE